MLRLRRLFRRAMFALLLVGLIVAYVGLDQRRLADGRITDAAGARVFVADGDTLRIGERTIRLAGIDAVEREQFCLAADGSTWSCGLRARSALEALVRPGGLACVRQATDQYRRTVATCRTTSVADIGAAMVEAGWAINEADRDSGRYALEEARAARNKRGIWAGRFDEPRAWRATRMPPAPKMSGKITNP